VLCALLAACGLPLACAAPQPAAPEVWEVVPLAWRAEGPKPGDGPMILLGSVHLGRSELHDFGPTIANAYATSDELVVEVDLSVLSERDMIAQTVPYMLYEDGRRLRDVLSPATWSKLEAYFRERGSDIARVEHMKPWAVATAVAVMEFQAAGMQGEYGVDQHFIAEAAAAKLPIRGLETLQSQMEALDGLSPQLQERMLEDALVRVATAAPAELVSAWEEGDEERLTQQLLGPLDDNPDFAEFYEALFFRRNEAMASQLAELVGDGRQRFVVIGAAHLLGERGIPELLRARGFRVARISVR